MGGDFKRLLLVGCEPQTFGPEEGHMGLSAPVEAAVTEAVGIVETLVMKVMSQETTQATR
jgi:hydrogenase maturation protease